MEGKERFEYYPKQNQLYDKINDELYCLGIKQDKTRLVDFLNLMNEDWWTLYERNKELREENQQLKQSQKQLAIEELKLALENFRNRPTHFDVARQELCLSDQDKQFIDFINNQIKELEGGKNDHN